MRGSLTGDFDQLRKLIERASAPRKLMDQATEAGETGVHEQYQADFAGSRNPWGGQWAPRKDGGGGRPLYQSGALADPAIVSSNGLIKVRPERYWVFHQVGANNMHERAVLPFSASNWDPPIQARIDDVVIGYFQP
jgi:phage gpG-like protein